LNIPEQKECMRHWILFLMEQKLHPYKMHRLERTLIDAITFSGGICVCQLKSTAKGLQKVQHCTNTIK